MTEAVQTTPIIQATWFTERGISVLPLSGKTGDVKKASPSTKLIKGNYGVALGDGLIGIDYDVYDGASNGDIFPDTRGWISGSQQGFGMLYKVSKDLSELGFSLGPGITVRGKGQYLVGPGSTHPGTPKKGIKAGGIYTLESDIEIAEAPEWLVLILEAQSTAAKETNLKLGDYTRPDWIFSDKNWKAKFESHSNTDRSGQTYNISAYSAERGASNEELAWIICNFKPALDKGHVKEEVLRVVKKIRDLHEHPGQPCDKAECPNKPDWMSKEVETFDFWNARPELAYIKQAAEARLVAPKAVLMAAVGRGIASVPTEFVLPPIIGAETSFNYFVCFVGESGGGKGTATKLAETLFDFKQTDINFTTSTPGSGEGVVSTYLKIKDNKWVQQYESALINFDEIDNFKATSDRQGSTLSAVIRQSFMGEQIGGTYSKTTKELLRNSYRMALLLSAQPLRSAGLLEDSDGGTPQRFIFIQTTNPECPDVDDLPEFPARLSWSPPKPILDVKASRNKRNEPQPILGKLDSPPEEVVVAEKQLIPIDVHPDIIRELKIARIDKIRTGHTKDEGHLGLTRLKTAFGLAYLNGRLDINLEDWKLSAIVMLWSKQAINQIKTALEHKNLKDQMARTTAAADRQEYLEKRSETGKLDDAKKKILGLVESGVNKIAGANMIKQQLRRQREFVDEAIESLIKENKIKYSEDMKELLPV